LLLELERIDVAGAQAKAAEHAVVETPGRASRRVAGGFGALGIVVVIALVTLALAGGDDSESETVPTTVVPIPTTVEEPLTIVPSTRFVPGPNVSAVLIAPPVTPTTTIPYANQQRAPVLGTGTGGLSLYAIAQSTLYRVELDTGRVTSVALPRTGSSRWFQAEVAGDRLMMIGDGGIYVLALDLSGSPFPISTSRRSFVGADVQGGYWFQSQSLSDGAMELQRVDGSGNPDREVRVEQAGLVPFGVVGDRVVLQAPGRIFTVDRDGRVEPYAEGSAVVAKGEWVLWAGCDDRARCTLHLGTSEISDTGRTSLELAYLRSEFPGAPVAVNSLAPDGATIVANVTGAAPGPKIVDLATGSVLDPASQIYGEPAWFPDGSWLVRTWNSSGVEAISVRTGRVVSIVLPGVVLNGSGDGNALAVG
jgi:hypothetical protein